MTGQALSSYQVTGYQLILSIAGRSLSLCEKYDTEKSFPEDLTEVVEESEVTPDTSLEASGRGSID